MTFEQKTEERWKFQLGGFECRGSKEGNGEWHLCAFRAKSVTPFVFVHGRSRIETFEALLFELGAVEAEIQAAAHDANATVDEIVRQLHALDQRCECGGPEGVNHDCGSMPSMSGEEMMPVDDAFGGKAGA